MIGLLQRIRGRLFQGRAEGVAAFAAGALGLVWFGERLSPGPAFTIWQASLLRRAFAESAAIASLASPPPLLSRFLSVCTEALPKVRPTFWLNVTAAVLGIVCCMLLAAMGALVGRRLAPRFEGINALAGFEAALILALTPTATYAATAAGPATLTLALALGSTVLFMSSWENQSKRIPVSLVVSGLLAGLATANHPSFALLAFVFMLGLILQGTPDKSFLRKTTAFTAAVLPGLLLPFVVAMFRGEGLRMFLAHALRTPYVTVADSFPSLGFTSVVAREIPYGLLGFVPIMAPLCFARSVRAPILLCTFLFLCFGPFLPFLTNHYGSTETARDADAPLLFVLASVSLFIALGATHIVELASARSGTWLPRSLCHLAICITILLVMAPRAPDRRHTFAEQTGTVILESCPRNALLVSGDRLLTSVILSTQAERGLRHDVRVVPGDALSLPHCRPALARLAGAAFSVAPTFSPSDKLDQWRAEQPWLVDDLLAHQGEAAPSRGKHRAKLSLEDLALWDFLRDNSVHRPVCFVGYSQDWLVARVRVSGTVLVFPAHSMPRTDPEVHVGALVREALHTARTKSDPGAAHSVAALLVPLSANARKQGNLEDATRWARAALVAEPSNASAHLALVRAAARSGDRDQALVHAQGYVASVLEEDAAGIAATAIQTDLDLWAYAERTTDLVRGDPVDPAVYTEFNALTAFLWRGYEFRQLTQLYESILSARPSDAFTLYQLAAAQAQLGELDSANMLLMKAIELAPSLVVRNLKEDGRFVLLKEAQERFGT
mgnify:CR=1 FL=1